MLVTSRSQLPRASPAHPVKNVIDGIMALTVDQWFPNRAGPAGASAPSGAGETSTGGSAAQMRKVFER